MLTALAFDGVGLTLINLVPVGVKQARGLPLLAGGAI